MDVDPKEIAPDVPQFFELLEKIPWFVNLGRPHRWDGEVARIHSWGEWPGPEGGYGHRYGRWASVVHEAIEASESDRREELQELWNRIYSFVLDRAARNVPLYDPNEDAWYGPTACVWHAAYFGALIGWHILLGRTIPKLIASEWRWFAEGHWPCDFAEEPVGIDETLAEFKLQVY